MSVTRVGDAAAGRPDARHGDLVGVLHEDGHRRLDVLSLDQVALDGEGANAGQDVAAVLRIGNDGLIDEDLQEQVIDVDAWTRRALDHRNLRGQWIGAAHAVDLAAVGRAHDAEQKLVARRHVARQIAGKKIAALGSAAAHPHAAHALDRGVRHTSIPWPRVCRACRRCRGPARRPPAARAWIPRWRRGPAPSSVPRPHSRGARRRHRRRRRR